MLCVGIGSAAALALAADTADLLFAKVRPGLVADVADFRGVVCMESVERTRYAPRKPIGNATCGQWIATMADSPRGALEWRSRLRLDVAAGPATEEFALTDASAFERADAGGILSAASAGSGEFGTFLRNLMAGDADEFQANRTGQTPTGKLLSFRFTVPAEKSHFHYGAAPVAYRGSLFAIPESGDLKRLTIQADNTGDACRVQYSTDYASTRVGDREIILPQSSVMEAIQPTGAELRSQTYYSGCRRLDNQRSGAARAMTSPAGSPKPIPPNIRLRVRFEPPIDSGTAATGDPVIGVIRTTVKDKQNGIVVRAGDRLHGRIASIEEYGSPQRRWSLAIVFETIERGVGEHGVDRGIEQPVSLVSIDGSDRSGVGHFTFEDASVLLDQKFETIWETR